MRMRRAGLGAVAVVVLLTTAACGDDDETVESGSDSAQDQGEDGAAGTGADPTGPTPIEPGDGAVIPEEPAQAELDATYVGLTKDEAIAAAEEAGVPWRIEREDGEDFALTMDYRPDRVNFSVEDGEVTAVRAG
jgi:hypothetical protein